MNRRFYHRPRLTLSLASVLLLTVLLASNSALAHRLNVFAWVEGNDIVAESKFSTGKRPKLGQVEVYNGEDKLLLSLKLDSNGKVRFPLPDYSSGLRIQINTGGDHNSYWVLTPFDIDSQRQQSNTTNSNAQP